MNEAVSYSMIHTVYIQGINIYIYIFIKSLFSFFVFIKNGKNISSEDLIEGAKRDECIVQEITLYDDLV